MIFLAKFQQMFMLVHVFKIFSYGGINGKILQGDSPTHEGGTLFREEAVHILLSLLVTYISMLQ